jgi:chemotaxis protein methyltransferase CheR
MRPDDVEAFRRLLLDRSGLALTGDKDYLLQSRLGPVARSAGLATVGDLLAQVRLQPLGVLAERAVDAMATHESFFFRDATPFDQLRDVLLPELIRARAASRRLRIWSAACASGQEPYSLAMLMLEELGRHPGWSFDILATDMSEPILKRAREAIYTDFETARGLSPERRTRWMTREGEGWRVAPSVRERVSFQRHNLLEGPGMLGRFDVIFCRNVLIYFDQARKAWTLDRLAGCLELGGALVLGSAETVVGLKAPFRPRAGLRGVFEVEREEKLRA